MGVMTQDPQIPTIGDEDCNRVDNSSVESNGKDISEQVSGSWIDSSKVGKIPGQDMLAKEEAEGLTPSAKKEELGTKSQSDLEKGAITETGSANTVLDTKAPQPDNSALPLILEDEVTYPEGGLTSWFVVLGGWCGMFSSLGIANTLATFQAYISENQLSSYSASQIGWIFSIWTFLTFACGIYVGPLFDVYGPRWLVLPGSICIILMMFLLGVCTQYWHFIVVFGILGGIGSALLFTPSIAAVGHFFYRRRGNATGIAAGGGAFGGIVFPLLLQSLTPKVGFAWSTRIMGFITLFLCIIANLLIRSRLPKSQIHRSPHPDFRILAQPAFAWTVIGVFLLEWALFIPLTYITSYAMEKHYSTAFAYQILPILNVGSVFGRWLPGFYSDVIGRYNTCLVVTAFTIFSVFAVWLPFGNHTAGLVVFVLLFGFASGSNISLTPVCIGQLCETKDYGRYYATCYTIVSLGCLTGIPIAGAILDACSGSYWGLVVWTGACYVIALLAFIVARGLGGSRKIWIKY
jgi:MFS family permease